MYYATGHPLPPRVVVDALDRGSSGHVLHFAMDLPMSVRSHDVTSAATMVMRDDFVEACCALLYPGRWTVVFRISENAIDDTVSTDSSIDLTEPSESDDDSDSYACRTIAAVMLDADGLVTDEVSFPLAPHPLVNALLVAKTRVVCAIEDTLWPVRATINS